jgi:hypothetical protein
MNNQKYLDRYYNTLVKNYGGKIVLLWECFVVFANILTRTVLKYAKSMFSADNWLIIRIGSGEIVFYES